MIGSYLQVSSLAFCKLAFSNFMHVTLQKILIEVCKQSEYSAALSRLAYRLSELWSSGSNNISNPLMFLELSLLWIADCWLSLLET